ncbi:ZmpA/ZmpB/ZmpC family metallo-endopeptidase-related protein, partial [Endozoicomonas sp. ONNA2]|uniref:ZmpA/ZmpB/ZmpC family metallo-endopeptidase-related protein n=1 Tax=Endozoicomonas sp. ONNA2 TaxID=2828741 RepID=UPI002147BEEB
MDGWECVNTAEELKKICTGNKRYTCEGKYWLKRDIDASQWQPIGSKIRPFKGELNSDNYTIRNLPDCLIRNLAGNGKIQNLRFTNANITSDKKTAGVVACYMSGNALVKNIHVIRSNLVANSTKSAHAGIAVGLVNAGTVVKITSINCTVTATGKGAKAGIGAGLIKEGGTVDKTMAVNCNVSTTGNEANAGIGAGLIKEGGTVDKTKAVNCNVSTTGYGADAGIGAGKNEGIVRNTLASKCKVSTTGYRAGAGIGAGKNRGTAKYTTAHKCTVLTKGDSSNAGVGAGESSKLDASSSWTVISDTAAFGCSVSTSGKSANAGIGAGYIEYQGSIDKTTAVKCTVTTSGARSNAGIGAGLIIEEEGTGASSNKGINITRVIESTIKSLKKPCNAAINGGHKPTVCNAKIINCKETKHERKNCHIDSNTACEGFDFGPARKNCQKVLDVLLSTDAPLTYPTTKPLTTASTLNISS